MKAKIIIFILLVLSITLQAKKKPDVFVQYQYGVQNQGTIITLKFEKGKEHNHPLFAVWLADENGKFIQTLYVSETIGKGIFPRVDRKTGMWKAGEIQRPATLPYWAHQRNIINEFGNYIPSRKHPEIDAYTGATPSGSFVLQLKTEKPLKGKYKIMLELNQSWDWNEFWYNNKYPENKEYMTSSQPAVVYQAFVDTDNSSAEVEMTLIGYSHYAGADGSLNPDLSSLTTALRIAKKVTVKLN